MLTHLLQVERQLTAGLRYAAPSSDVYPAGMDMAQLSELKGILDRMRPLLWIYISRESARPPKRKPQSVSA